MPNAKNKKKTEISKMIDFRIISPDETNFKGHIKIEGSKIVKGELDINLKPGTISNLRAVEAEIKNPINLTEIQNSVHFLQAASKELEEILNYAKTLKNLQNVKTDQLNKTATYFLQKLEFLLDAISKSRDELLLKDIVKFPADIFESQKRFDPHLPPGIVVAFNVFEKQLVISLFVLKLHRANSQTMNIQDHTTRYIGRAVTVGETFHALGHKIQVLDYVTIFCKVPRFNRAMKILDSLYDTAAEWLYKFQVLQS